MTIGSFEAICKLSLHFDFKVLGGTGITGRFKGVELIGIIVAKLHTMFSSTSRLLLVDIKLYVLAASNFAIFMASWTSSKR
jgi:hypothetical protein